MGKGWDLGFADAGCTGKSSHSAAPDPYDWPLTDRSHAVYMHASGAPSSACEQRWTLEMVAAVEVAVVHLLVLPLLLCLPWHAILFYEGLVNGRPNKLCGSN